MGAGVMGLATALGARPGGTERGGLRAVRGRARQRLESRRLAHRSPLLSRGTLGAAGAGGVSALAGARGRLGPRAARPARDDRSRRLAGDTGMRWPRAASPFEVLDAAETGRRFPIRLENGESGLFQPDGGIVYADLALQALLGAATAAGAELRERTRVASIEDEGETVSLDGLACEGRRRDGGCVGAGPRGRGCDADARDRVVLRLRRARAVACSTRASVRPTTMRWRRRASG